MPITYKTYDVAFLRDGEIVETEVVVHKSDELRAELEGRRFGLKGPLSDGKTVTDLGDHENLEALAIWAALVRTKQYEGKSATFRLEDCVAWDKHRGPDGEPSPGEPLDPTRPVTSTGPASPAQPPSGDSVSG